MDKINLKFLKNRKKQIDHYLLNLLDEKKSAYQHHQEADFLFNYLEKFIISGKTIRGSLFLESLSLFGKTEEEVESFIPIAAAMEIIHSALLIQDDYMDQDDTRRGFVSLHKKVEKQAELNKSRKPQLQSISSMICATDICFFIAFGEIAKSQPHSLPKIISFLSDEYTNVGFAQWKDVELGLSIEKAKLSSIKDIYLYKTARYTFVLPLICAAIITEQSNEIIQKVEKIGESMGMVYQITDDYLSLFGDPTETGKPVGSDIIEDKQTIYKYYLTKEIKREEHKKYQPLLSFFGKKDLNSQEITMIQEAITVARVQSTVDSLIGDYQNSFYENINEINNQSLRTVMTDLFSFIKNRKK